MLQRDDAYFWEGARHGKLLLRTCGSCDRVAHPPVPMCPHCNALDWTTRTASGRGTVHAWIESRHPSNPDTAPRIVALIDLEEGVRIVSNLIDIALDAVTPGAPVAVTFETVGDHIIPQFSVVKG